MGKQVTIELGDITKIETDAIVNAANSSLSGGGGVDGAIHRAGGKKIREACKKIRDRQGGCKPGKSVLTTAGELPANFVIHTVGPVWEGGKSNEIGILRNAYRNSLQLAADHEIKTVAFPNISTGIYNFPKQLASQIAITAVLEFMSRPTSIETVVFVCFDQENYDIYQEELDAH